MTDKARKSRLARRACLVCACFLLAGLTTGNARGDEVRIRNGDHYSGQVVSLSSSNLVLQSPTLGRLTLARPQVASILLVPGFTNKTATVQATNAEDEVWTRNGDRLGGRVVSLGPTTLVLKSAVLGDLNVARREATCITLAPPATNKVALAALAARAGAAQPGVPGAAWPQMDLSDPAIAGVKSQFLDGAGPEANKQFDDLLAGLMSGKLNLNDIRSQAQSVIAQAQAMKKDLGNDPSAAAMDSYLEILDSFLRQTSPTTNPPAPAR